MRPGAFLRSIVGTVFCISLVAAPAAGAATPFTRDAIDYLKTRGLLPLWTGITRPILRWDLNEALDVGQRLYQLGPLSVADRAVLKVLDPAFDSTDVSEGMSRYTAEASLVAPYGKPLAYAQLSTRSGPSAVMGGWAVNSPTAAVAANSGGVSWLAGRSPFGWGPAPLGSELSLDEAAGGFDALELSFVWMRARFTKVVGWLDAGHSIVGTRMDIPYRPNLRLGFAETIVMDGSPYVPYLIHPVPIGVNPPLMAQFRLPRGIVDNIDLSADLEWVPEPGVRFFAEVLVDDITVPTPTQDLPSKWGLTGGFHIVHDDGSSVQGLYTMMLNWVYVETTGLNFALRGLPLGHVLGPDFDLIHVRWMSSPPPASSTWVTYVRKGPGRIGVIWANQAQAWQQLFLDGVVEHSLLIGFDTPFESPGWTGKFGPWAAYRVNANNVAGATRVDWGINLEAVWSN